jgi:hypothetical protein
MNSGSSNSDQERKMSRIHRFAQIYKEFKLFNWSLKALLFVWFELAEAIESSTTDFLFALDADSFLYHVTVREFRTW